MTAREWTTRRDSATRPESSRNSGVAQQQKGWEQLYSKAASETSTHRYLSGMKLGKVVEESGWVGGCSYSHFLRLFFILGWYTCYRSHQVKAYTFFVAMLPATDQRPHCGQVWACLISRQQPVVEFLWVWDKQAEWALGATGTAMALVSGPALGCEQQVRYTFSTTDFINNYCKHLSSLSHFLPFT